MTILDKRLIKSTDLYDLYEEDWAFSGNDNVTVKSGYNKSGVRIGDENTTTAICDKRKINPEAVGKDTICSIGKSEDGKWYGWSHRAIYGFVVGSTCKKGDCHFLPSNELDAIEDGIRFWSDKEHLNITAGAVEEREGRKGVLITWTYSDAVHNERMRNTEGSIFHEFPDKWGKGEWTAKTEEDAKQMAIDFANSVS
jgi:hypothetical protein